MGRPSLIATLIVLLAAGPVRAQQTPPPPPEPEPPLQTSEVSLGRIRRALGAPEPKLTTQPKGKPLFSVEIVGKKPPFIAEFSTALLVSNVTPPKGPAWHREFLEMVTPQDLNSSEITSPVDTLFMSLQTAAAFWLAKTIIKKVSARDLRAVREQIQREVDEIEARKRERDAKPWLYVPF